MRIWTRGSRTRMGGREGKGSTERGRKAPYGGRTKKKYAYGGSAKILPRERFKTKKKITSRKKKATKRARGLYNNIQKEAGRGREKKKCWWGKD